LATTFFFPTFLFPDRRTKLDHLSLEERKALIRQKLAQREAHDDVAAG
jgi:hypothetical protein